MVKMDIWHAFILLLLFDSSYVLGFVDSFVLYFLICASKRILFFDDENIPKNRANNMRATLACRFTCYVLRMCYRFLLVMRKEIQ